MWTGYKGIVSKDISLGNKLIGKYMGVSPEAYVIMDYDISWDSLIPVLVSMIQDKEISFFMKDLGVVIRHKGDALYIGAVGSEGITNLHELIYQCILVYIVHVKRVRI